MYGAKRAPEEQWPDFPRRVSSLIDPEGIVRRMVQASSAPGDLCLDPFAGSGTLGAVAAALDRRYLLIDDNPDAVAVMLRRLA